MLIIREIIKEQPINRESEAGLTFYDNDLAYHYLAAYEDCKSTMEMENGEVIIVLTNGDTSERISFNSKNGRIIAYIEKDDLTRTYSYSGVTMTTRDIVDVRLSITYSNK